MAEKAGLPMMQAKIIPPHVGDAYKHTKHAQKPALLLTCANGGPVEKQADIFPDFDLQQPLLDMEQNLKNPTFYYLLPKIPKHEKRGLTRRVIQTMATHKDLPKIVAFDTFVGNIDRNKGNIFYDPVTDQFCGIDLDQSFMADLCQEACTQLQTLQQQAATSLTSEEIAGLKIYRSMLQQLLTQCPAEATKQKILDYYGICGFSTEDLKEAVMFHQKLIDESYQSCQKLVTLLDQIVMP